MIMFFYCPGLFFISLPLQASAPPVYGISEALPPAPHPPHPQGRFVDMESGLNGTGGSGGYYPATILTSDQQRQQQQAQQLQQFYAAAAAANCYPLDFQLFATAPRIAPPDPYWTAAAAAASRYPLTWYPSSSRGHPTPPPPARDDSQQECYYSDLAAALHSMRLSGSGQGSGVPSERGTYSPIQYASWAYPTASTSSQTSSSPFPTLYGAPLAQQHQHQVHQHQQQQQQHPGRHRQQQHHPASSNAVVAAAAVAAAAAAASRLHQTDFDPKELVRMCPGYLALIRIFAFVREFTWASHWQEIDKRLKELTA